MKKTILSLLLTLLLATTIYTQVNEMTLVGQYVGENDADYFGGATAMGDFDNDGYNEFIIGTMYWNEARGKNYYYEWDGDWPVDPAWTFQGDTAYCAYNNCDQNLGDINGDGIDDFGLTEQNYLIQTQSHLDILLGSEPFDSIPDLSLLWGSWSNVGRSLDSLGDVNGDCENDFIICSVVSGGWWWEYRIYHGGTILDTIPDWLYLSGYQRRSQGLGDVNGDGCNDIILTGGVTAPVLFFGGANMDTIPDVVFSDYTYNQNAAIGDVNDDGYNDFSLDLIPNHNTTGRAIYFGGATPDTVADGYLQDEFGNPTWAPYFVTHGDVNGDGISDLITGDVNWWGRACYIYLGSRWFNTVPDEVILGVYSWFNWGEEISVGDVNNDGRDEILISSSDYWFDTGLVQLFTGSEEWIDYGAPVEPGDLPHTPGWYKLDQNYPNPFNATTVISFELPVGGYVSLEVFDIQGRNVISGSGTTPTTGFSGRCKTPKGTGDPYAGEFFPPGRHSVTFDAGDLPSGVYIVRLSAGEYTPARKMVLLR